MTHYLISFGDDAMDFTDEEFAEVVRTSHEAFRELEAAGVVVFGGGLVRPGSPTVVDADGTATEASVPESRPHLGGMTIIDVATEREAVHWAATIARGCRVPQYLRAFGDDPEVD